MAVTGMDIEQVRMLGTLLRNQLDAVNGIVSSIESSLSNTVWIGPDAETFRNEWWPQHKTNLQSIGNQLVGFGDAAHNNANEQEATSGR